MASIQFTASGSCSALGNFEPGDIARNIPDALAEHLVKEASCAKYFGTTVQAATPAAADKPARARKPKPAAAD